MSLAHNVEITTLLSASPDAAGPMPTMLRTTLLAPAQPRQPSHRTAHICRRCAHALVTLLAQFAVPSEYERVFVRFSRSCAGETNVQSLTCPILRVQSCPTCAAAHVTSNQCTRLLASVAGDIVHTRRITHRSDYASSVTLETLVRPAHSARQEFCSSVVSRTVTTNAYCE